MSRVFITGASVVSPIGNNLEEFFHGIQTGKKGIGKIAGFNTEHFPSNLGAEVKKLQINSVGDRKKGFIKKALQELLDTSAHIHDYVPEQRFLNLGAGLDYFDLANYVSSKEAALGKWQSYSNNTHTIVSKLASQYNIKGGFTVNVTACVASAQAIGLSYRMLKSSTDEKIIISGGFDSMLNPLHYMGFYKLGALSSWQGRPENACRPFDKDRCGLVLGEGAAVLLLQNATKAPPECILGEITGYDSTMDAYMVSDPHPEGIRLARAALNAIEESGITPDAIDCVHLHGTGTKKNAIAESKAMQLIFPKTYNEVPVFSLKGQIGHLIAACGAVEMLGVIYSIQTQQIPPTINYELADPEVPLNVIKERPLKKHINYILKLNSAFGGQNTAFVVKRYVQ